MEATMDLKVYKAFRTEVRGWQRMPYPRPAITAIRDLRFKPQWDVVELDDDSGKTGNMEHYAWVFKTDLEPGFEVKVRVALVYDQSSDMPWEDDESIGTPSEYRSDDGPMVYVEKHGAYLNHGKTRVVTYWDGHNSRHYVFDWSEWFDEITPPRGMSKHNAWLYKMGVLDDQQRILDEWLKDQWYYSNLHVQVFHQGVELAGTWLGSVEDHGWVAPKDLRYRSYRTWQEWSWLCDYTDDAIDEALWEAKKNAIKTLTEQIAKHDLQSLALRTSLNILKGE